MNIEQESPCIEQITLGEETIERVTYPDGARQYNDTLHNYPSVTTVIKATESKNERDRLRNWMHKMDQVHGQGGANQVRTDRATEGKATHKLIEAYIKGELGQYPDDPFLENARSFLNLFRQNHVAVEEFITSPHPYGYAGTPDVVAEFAGKLSIIDWTTSQRIRRKQWIRRKLLQTTAYALAWQVRKHESIEQSVVIVLTKGRPQLFVEDISPYIPQWEERLHRFYDDELWYQLGLELTAMEEDAAGETLEAEEANDCS